MKGVWNKILKVDLTQGTCEAESVPDHVYEYFVGGAGLAAYYLWKECPKGTTAFNPANRLTMAVGPLQAAASRRPAASKHRIVGLRGTVSGFDVDPDLLEERCRQNPAGANNDGIVGKTQFLSGVADKHVVGVY